MGIQVRNKHMSVQGALSPRPRRQFLSTLAGLAVAAGLGQRAGRADQVVRLPNIIVVFADDLGYADLSCYGSETITTTHIDRLAVEGMRFTDFHTCSPVCTPSRAALLTGSYAARIGLEKGVLFPNAPIGLSPEEMTIADVLKGQGYATQCIGKWHLGDQPAFLPTRHGFQHYFGLPFSNDMQITRHGKSGLPLMRQEQIVEHPVDQATLTERYTQEALQFIAAHRHRPFFLYLPHTFPHTPLFVSERFKGRSKGGLYGDVVETIDWSVGQILETLHTLGIDEHTLVVFTSDNGPALEQANQGGSAKPLRAGKGTVYEGGHRVPCLVRWPGHIPAGAVCTEFASTMDFLPTFATLAGTTAPADRVIDGYDIWPLLAGQRGAKTPYAGFFHYSAQGPLHAVRVGPWKLHLKRRVKQWFRHVEQDVSELYHLGEDLGEVTNRATQHPELVARLTRLAQEHQQELARHRRPVGRIH